MTNQINSGPTGADLDAGKWDLDDQLMNQLVDKWADKTSAVEEDSVHVPMAVFLGEAVDLAALVQENFTTRTRNGETVKGLEVVAATGAVTSQTPEELRELAMAVGAVRARIRKLVEAQNNSSVAEAEEVLDELRSTLTFVLEESGDARAEEQIARLAEDHRDADSHDEVALALQAYAELADEHKKSLSLIGLFDMDLPAKARGLAQALRQRSADKLTGKVAQEAKSAMRLRNRLIGALSEKMRVVRKAIRFVFRKHPDIVKAASSSYQRERRRAWLKKQKSAAPNSGVVATDETMEIASPSAAGANRG